MALRDCTRDRPYGAYVDLSTTGPATSDRWRPNCPAGGIRCVDAPVSGGPAPCRSWHAHRDGASGAEDAIGLIRPLLDVIGSKVFVVGSQPGQAQLVKLINNLLSATAIAVTGEALALAAKSGLDPGLVLDVSTSALEPTPLPLTSSRSK